MEQKVIKVGTSSGVTIPKKSMKVLGLEVGSLVSITVDEKEKRMIVQAATKEATVDPETVAWTKAFTNEYKDVLDELAQK